MSIKARITVGDWSDDGHGQTDVIDIFIPEGLTAKSEGWDKKAYINKKSHKSRGCSNEPDLWFYYDLAVKSGLPDLCGFCKDYEDSIIQEALVKEIFENLGKDVDEQTFEYEDDEEFEDRMVCVDVDMFAELWVGYVNHGIKLNGETGEVKTFDKVKKKAPNYNIGGYGLFL